MEAAIIRLLAVVAASGALVACYSPDLADCTVSCSADTDCGGDQVCGADRLCAAPDIAGQCADNMPAVQVQLKVIVEGRGRVQLGTSRTCGKLDADRDDCIWQVTRSAPLVLSATPTTDYRFDHWTTDNCKDQPPSCTLTIAAPATVGVKFKAK